MSSPVSSPLSERVRIVGGGLTGLLAAFQAHQLGARDITIYERLDRIGGIALPECVDGMEMREGCIYFGPAGDPIRSLLEAHGVRFEEFPNRFGSVSPAVDGAVHTEDFGGPALRTDSLRLDRPVGPSLADRLASYDDSLARPLQDYVHWHTGMTSEKLHADAAIPLAINRVFPTGVDVGDVAAAKQADALADDLFGVPRGLWGYAPNGTASLPIGGFTTLFAQCRKALDAIGVTLHDSSMVSAKQLLAERTPDCTTVWAASPMALFKPLGLAAPRAPARKFATLTFAAEWRGPLPFYVQNFTGTGSCFRAYIYESDGRTLLTAECVQAPEPETLAREIDDLLAGFDGALVLGEVLHRTVKPRWLYHSVETISALAALRRKLFAMHGDRFVCGAWEAYAKGSKFAEVESALSRALDPAGMARAS